MILANIATESNVNSYILNQLSRTSWFDKADNFVDYLRSSKQSLNLGTVGSIFKCFYRMYESKDYKSVTIKDKFILELYSELKSKYKVLDHTTLEHCISALSCTKKWEECFDLLEKIKVLGSPSTFTFNSLAASSFKNNDPENGWKVLKEATYYDRQLYSSSYKAAIDYYIKEHNKDSKQLYVSIEKLLNFIIENNLSLDKVAAEEFSEVFVSHFRWASDSVHIDKRCVCTFFLIL